MSKFLNFVILVYGYYDDISPADFLETQLDLKYRKKWDNSVLKLDLVESDERNQVDIVHWEMQWPRMFSNRDYCFARRHLVDKTKNTMIILNKYLFSCFRFGISTAKCCLFPQHFCEFLESLEA